MNVICISVGSAGDVLPFLHLGRRLQERGHKVTLLSHYSYEEAASRSGLQFISLDNPQEYGRFVEDQPLLNSPKGTCEFLRRHLLPKVPSQYKLLAQLSSGGNTVLLTRDLFDIASRFAAEQLSIPVLWIFFSPSQIATWKLRAEMFSSALASDIHEIRNLLGLSPVSDGYWSNYGDHNIAFWPEWFAPIEPDEPFALARVGFILQNEATSDKVPSDVEAILNDDEPPILITAGTGAYLGAEFYTASAEACRLLNRRGIVVTQYPKQLPKKLPNSVFEFSYLPFSVFMSRMGAIVHHGGMGTVSCAMAAGVPQLVLPMGADRPYNALRLQRLGVAEVVSPTKWKPEILAAALRRLMTDSALLDRCRALAERIRCQDASTAACEIIESVGAK